MAIVLDFQVNTTGLSDAEKITRIVSEIGKQSNVSAGQLKIFESALRADAAAGVSLDQSLKDLAKSSSTVGKEVSGFARSVLDAEKAAQRAQAEVQKLGKMIPFR